MSIIRPALYVVATPIGNLGDMSQRARDVLAGVDRVAAEDTRHSGRLLAHFGIATPLISLHEHNEARRTESLLARLEAGEAVALISDAGTPLISDPGFVLVRAARAAGYPVLAVPGPSALVAALSIAGLPTDRFVFEGFLPAKAAARAARLRALREEPRTLVFYESPRRVDATLAALAEVFGEAREMVLARELTKQHETVLDGDIRAVRAAWEADPGAQRGEVVLVVGGAPAAAETELDAESRRVLDLLRGELPLKQAAALAARITGAKKNALYQYGLAASGGEDEAD